MKFRRNVHLYRGSLDATPLATLFFLLVIFLVLAARMYTPGVHIQLPAADHPMPGSDKSPINVAVDAAGRHADTVSARVSGCGPRRPLDRQLLAYADQRAIRDDLARTRVDD